MLKGIELPFCSKCIVNDCKIRKMCGKDFFSVITDILTKALCCSTGYWTKYKSYAIDMISLCNIKY